MNHPNHIHLARRTLPIRRPLSCLGFLLMAAIACLGCQRSNEEPSSNEENTSVVAPPSSSKTTSSSKTAPSSQPAVVAVSLASWEDVQREAAASGKVTVLDVWSTVCAPCIKELPGLVKLHQELGDQVQCMTMDVDFDGRKSKPPATYEQDVLSLLTDLGANFPNYISTTASDDVYAAAEIDSIPAVLVFDAKGKLVKKFVDAGDEAGFGYHDDVVPFVKSLLKKSP